MKHTKRTKTPQTPVFDVHSLKQTTSDFSLHFSERNRLIDEFRRLFHQGQHIIICGPAGSGKSTVALQIALRRFQEVLYIGTRDVPYAFEGLSSHPDHPLALITNQVADRTLHDMDIAFQTSIDSIAEHMAACQTALIFDDVDVLLATRAGENVVQALGRQSDITVFWVTRGDAESLSACLNADIPRRLVLPGMIAMQEADIPAFITTRTFGNVKAGEIRSLITKTGGWFAGMQFLLEFERGGMQALDAYVRHEILEAAPRMIQHVTLALAILPRISTALVEHLLKSAGSSYSANTLISSLPVSPISPGPGRSSDFQFPPVLAESFKRLTPLLGEASRVHEMVLAALRWYIESGDTQSAKHLSNNEGLEQEYLHIIVPICAIYAAEEQWIQIRNLLVDSPESLVFGDVDLAFWYMKGCSYVGDWESVTKIRHVVLGGWLESQNSLERGRGLIIQSWRNWTQSRPEEALQYATEAYEVLPNDALQDKLWAAIQAENAARNLGELASIEKWSAQAGSFGTRMTVSPEFWHINCGYHRLNYLALTGKLGHAYELAGMFVLQAPSSFPHAKFRYPVLKAFLDMERDQMSSAKSNLDLAANLAFTIPIQSQLDLARSTFLLQQGDTEGALELLGLDGEGRSSRPDHYLHRVRLAARIRLAQGDVELAHYILSNWCQGQEQWPKYFGEPHHHLLMAKALLMMGKVNEANEWAQFVINEAHRRGHLFYSFEAYAIQAECQHHFGPGADQSASIAAALAPAIDERALHSLSPMGTDVRTFLAGDFETVEKPSTFQSHRARQHRELDPPNSKKLTSRENELLEAIAEGMTTRQMADEFFISPNTVKNHVASIFRKLGVNNRKQAIELVFPLRNTNKDG